MKYGVFSQNEFIYTDSYLQNGKETISVDAPRGSFAAAQVAFRASSNVKIRWEGDLPSPQIYRLVPVYVGCNSDIGFNGTNYLVPKGEFVNWATRKAPFSVFDAMESITDRVKIYDEGNTAIYLKWSTFGLAAGKYSGTLKLTDNEETVEIPVAVTVFPVEVPRKETLRVTNWFRPEFMASHFGCEKFSDEHWESIKKHGEIMREARQTDFIVTQFLFRHTIDESGNNHFDFTNAKRFIELYLSLGFSYIEGPIMLFRTDWHSPNILVRIKGEAVSAVGEKGIKYLSDFFTQWYAFLKENGWTKITTQHICDEPGEHCIPEYKILSDLVHKCMPGVKTIEALADPSFADTVDIMVPKSIRYLKNKDAFDKIKQEREVWFYTCCDPGGEYLNRLLDQELIRTRYLHWTNYIYGLKGYLHWGFNQYVYKELFVCCEEKNGASDGPLPAGDSHIVYPKDNKLLPSVRLEMMRAGCEDYELISLLAKKNKQKADAIVSSVIRSFTDYTKNVDEFEAAYKKLLEML